MIQQRTLFLSIAAFFLPLFVSAGTIIHPHIYAWSNAVGYINFENVTVSNSALSGYAWSANKGFIKFNPVQGGVFNNGAGDLSGFAWGEQLGWIDFNAVSIGSNGKFSGTASGDLAGTITFDCSNYCDVETDWRPAASVPVSSASTIAGGVPLLFRESESVVSGLSDTGETVGEIARERVRETVQTETPSSEGVVTPVEAPDSSTPPAVAENVALFDVISEPVKERVDTSSAGLITKVAAGELLPISVKLANFGGGKRVDVLVKYSIFNNVGTEIYSTNETVAVETTANFVKTIQIPFDTPPGRYVVKTAIIYGGQVVPAITEFPFTVERKILGLFQSDFFLYGGIILLASLAAVLFGYGLMSRRRTRYEPFDYSNQPKNNRIYYEIVSDTIGQMRQQSGERALEIAAHTPGLIIDEKTGRVLGITESPSKVVANLVSEYEKTLGKKVSFSFRNKD